MPNTLAFATALGTLFGVAVVFWAAPHTSSGAVFLIVAGVMLCNLLAALGSWLASLLGGKATGPSGGQSP